MQHPIRAIGAWAVVLLAVLVAVPALLPGSAIAQDTRVPPGIDPGLLADASWHGRPIQRPVPRATSVTDRSPGLTRGTGYRTPAGSQRVRDLQRRLLRLGYRPGTRDGRYGPRTQAAVVRAVVMWRRRGMSVSRLRTRASLVAKRTSVARSGFPASAQNRVN